MNYTIHLTEGCNLNCTYCYENNYYNKINNEISFENIKKIIDRESDTNGQSCLITFYGGEPLLKKDLIYKTVEYVKSKKTTTKFYFSMTTNGTLMDEDFIRFVKKNDFINISYSIDGNQSTHDLNRCFTNGTGSFSIVEKNAINLIKVFKSTVAMMVVTKNNLHNLCENIKYLYSLGFETFNTQFNYSEDWNDDDLIVIEKELEKISDFYYETMSNNKKISVIIFDEKIRSHVNDDFDCNVSCIKKHNTVHVGVDGKFYYCVQFVYNSEYHLGDCENGVDNELLNNIFSKLGKEHPECDSCSIKTRCKHKCPCKNFALTQDVNGLSPVVCEFERLFIRISDKLAEKLYNEKNDLFIQKFYTM